MFIDSVYIKFKIIIKLLKSMSDQCLSLTEQIVGDGDKAAIEFDPKKEQNNSRSDYRVLYLYLGSNIPPFYFVNVH